MSSAEFGGYRAAFRNRGFALFWTGMSVSMVGDAATRVALTWHVYETTGSAVALGWLAFLFTAPVVVGGFVAGWLLDRFDRRTILIVDCLLKALVVGSVPIVHAAGSLASWHVYAVAGVYGFLMMIPLAGAPALIPALVHESELTAANALETTAYTLSGVIGPPLAGVLIGAVGAPNVLLLDAVSYMAFAAMLTGVTTRDPPRPIATNRHRSGYGDAIRLLVGNKILLTTTAMYMVFNVGEGAMRVWLPVFTDRVQGGGAALYGVLLGGLAAGEVASSILAGLVMRPLPLGRLICLAEVLGGLALVPILLGAGRTSVILSLVAYGFCTAPLTIWAQTLRMKIIPEDLRGRSFALLRTLMQGTNPLGAMAAGLALPAVGVSVIIGVSVAATLLPGTLGLRVRALVQAR